ncbi:CotH kinase family protein [Flavobacterium sp. W22_SRS_FP1]|uniref:CotH kinase family protein n=1 Tax=Flavobacterium sp. W22_SRS_FP1 TaxID=3240276 RepID=UPI003F928C7B
MIRAKQIIPFFILFLVLGCSKDESISNVDEVANFAVEIGNSEIPYIQITSPNQILNEPKVAAEMKIFTNKKLVIKTPIGIEYRGSTSYRISDKKSFGVETHDASGKDIDLSILGFPAEEDWILMGDVISNNLIFDPTLMHHYVGYELFRKMGNYSSRSKFVELEINGVYLGIYVLMEKLKHGPDRINVETLLASDTDNTRITGGYILKIDKTSGGDVLGTHPLDYYLNNWDDDARYTELNSFRSDFDINKNLISWPAYGLPYHSNKYLETYFVYDYPSADKINTAQKSYIQKYIKEFETALINDNFANDTRTYTNYIDLRSFADFFIINEVCGNVDGYRLSTYMSKARGQKLKMGPIWDLNIGYNTNVGNSVPYDDWIMNYNNYHPGDAWMVPFWWKRLMEDPKFKAELKNRWIALRADVLSTPNVLSLTSNTASFLNANNAIGRNFTKWNGIDFDYNNGVNDMKTYLSNRLQWMDSQILAF